MFACLYRKCTDNFEMPRKTFYWLGNGNSMVFFQSTNREDCQTAEIASNELRKLIHLHREITQFIIHFNFIQTKTNKSF